MKCFYSFLITVTLFTAALAHAQTGGTQIAGVSIDSNGVIGFREQDAKKELDQIRARPKNPNSVQQDKLRYVSLPKVFGEAKAALDAKQPVPATARYLQGLTRLDYILIYPEEHDLVIAGPSEEVDPVNPMQPRGKISGKPVLQLEDLVTALRMTFADRGPQPFGCSIDPPPDSLNKAQEIYRQQMPRAQMVKALADAIGPQPIRVFGAPPESRTAFVCVAADYQLKRYTLNLDPVPVSGIGSPVDSSRPAANSFWFETLYQPLLVSADKDAFQLRGQRLQLKCGRLPFVDDRDATETAKRFATRFTEKVPQLAQIAPIYADLQNLADLSLLTALMRQEKLAQNVDWDFAWALNEEKYPVHKLPVPKQTPTLANFTSGSIVAGGVRISSSAFVAGNERETDDSGRLQDVRGKRSTAGN